MSRQLDKLAAQIAAQDKWIEQCGGTLAGYIARYGSASEPNHYGDGGEAIYAADYGTLQRLVHAYRSLAGRRRQARRDAQHRDAQARFA
jgi:hypothetical protein